MQKSVGRTRVGKTRFRPLRFRSRPRKGSPAPGPVKKKHAAEWKKRIGKMLKKGLRLKGGQGEGRNQWH